MLMKNWKRENGWENSGEFFEIKIKLINTNELWRIFLK